jgi:hypothetical protein
LASTFDLYRNLKYFIVFGIFLFVHLLLKCIVGASLKGFLQDY